MILPSGDGSYSLLQPGGRREVARGPLLLQLGMQLSALLWEDLVGSDGDCDKLGDREGSPADGERDHGAVDDFDVSKEEEVSLNSSPYIGVRLAESAQVGGVLSANLADG